MAVQPVSVISRPGRDAECSKTSPYKQQSQNRKMLGDSVVTESSVEDDGVPDYIVQRAAKVAQEFEALVLSHSLKQMPIGLHDNPIVGGGNAEQMWYSFLIDEYGKKLAEQNHLRIKDMVQKNLLFIQEQQGRKHQSHAVGYGIIKGKIDVKE